MTLTHVRTSEDFSLADLLDVCREAGKPVCVWRERERERERRERERERGSITACAFPSLFVALFLA